MARAYPPPHGPEAVWSETTLLAHLDIFPEGQWVAEAPNGEVVASATTMRVAKEAALAPHTWMEITGGGKFSTHDPKGEVLYGVNIVVDPPHQGEGLARRLYEARIQLGWRIGCRWMVAGARIPGYHAYATRMTPEEYVAAVVERAIFDPTLSKQLKVGFQCWGVLTNYAPDPETLGHAALIVMPLEDRRAL